MNDFVLIRVSDTVVVDIIRLRSAGSYSEALADLAEREGDEPTANWVTVAVGKPTKEVNPVGAPVQKMGYDLKVPILPTFILQSSIGDYAKFCLRQVKGSEDLKWGRMGFDAAFNDALHRFDDEDILPVCPVDDLDDNPCVVDLGTALADAAAKEADEAGEYAAPACDEDVADSEWGHVIASRSGVEVVPESGLVFCLVSAMTDGDSES